MTVPPAPLSPALLDRLAPTRLLALDVDGTLTDGRVTYVGEEEQQAFCVRDGQGLAWLKQADVALAWITGRGCRATERRAAELGVDVLEVRSGKKDEHLAAIQARLGIPPEETVAMGDDLPDLGLGLRASVLACPADARVELLERSDLVTAAPGGAGAVRELAEAILRAKGLWEPILDRYGHSAV